MLKNPLVAKLELAPTLEFNQEMLPSIRPVSNRVFSLLLLLPVAPPSSSTDPVSSLELPAEPRSTTPSPLSVGELRTVLTTGSSETPGIPHGVMPVTLRSLPRKVKVFALLSTTPTLSLPTESDNKTKSLKFQTHQFDPDICQI
jgi:hypothetical protein